ncbi:macro domain-containing protein [Natronosalvus caseinilyticus]|uniref:macro domain-containing protein n=1 Tax=Natronosalvus caseinilyticus TaxID=2953747 RepID=UPI0028A95A3B|nr:macro domain-containing protein [Natronosalvus caseinilyticus]
MHRPPHQTLNSRSYGNTRRKPALQGGEDVNDAYDLDAEYVIHAAAMPHYGSGRATPQSIRDATRNTLEKADELSCESLVIPILGTGVAVFDFESGAQLVCEEVWLYEPTSLTDVGVIAYSKPEYQTVTELADRLHSS